MKPFARSSFRPDQSSIDFHSPVSEGEDPAPEGCVRMKKPTVLAKLLLLTLMAVPIQDLAGTKDFSHGISPSAIPPVANPCPRLPPGSLVRNPPALFSHGRVLKVNFSYQTATDEDGRTLYCFMTPDGLENPTLHVRPGDDLIVNVTNNTPSAPVEMQIDPPNCGATAITGSSVNIHYHGTNTSPSCHQDEVIHTVINSGESFRYRIHFPSDEPPGLYWYHPHIHMHVEPALQGGASGAIIVDGIENLQPIVAGLAQRIMIIRDQILAGSPPEGNDVPSWDLTLNNIPIAYPEETPAVIQMKDGQRQLWRVSNSSADSILDLQVLYDGNPQKLQIIARDGVPVGSQDGSRHGKIISAKHVFIPTAGRAEFIVTGPQAGVRDARLVTLGVNTGPDGDNDPPRTLATIQAVSTETTAMSEPDSFVPPALGSAWKQRFERVASVRPTRVRRLFFSENNPLSQFFITQEGDTPTLFDPNGSPSIVTSQGSVEDWTIENRTLENHEFHIHQLHFLVLAQNNFEVNGSVPDRTIQGQFLDTVQLPFWDGNPGHPFPSVTVRLDFRGPDIGDFVFHCHIAEHEDNGMMALIRVEPSS